MYLFQRVLKKIQEWFRREQKTNFTLDVETLRSLQSLAEREQRSPEEIANKLLHDALRTHQEQQANWGRWQSLTPREQEIAALICLNYTSRQIATRLVISPETVKTHVEHILDKFEVTDRNMLRMLLNEWDFSAWKE